MLEKPDFNTLINHVVFTVDFLLKDKDYPKELVSDLYLVTTGMILLYGNEFIEDIYDTISELKFFFKDKNKDVITRKSLFTYDNPASHNYLVKSYDFTSSFPTIKIDYELFYKKIDSSNIRTLEYLVHEINYILFNKNKKIKIKDNLKLRFNHLTNSVIDDDINKIDTFDRIINILQAEEIIKQLLKLKEYDIKNKKFSSAIRYLKTLNYKMYVFEGLDILTNLFRPLYKYNNVKILINNNMFDKGILEKEFDKVLGKNSYKNVCEKLDNLNDLISVSNNKNKSYFELSVEYIDIRNNFVNKYIKYLKKAS